MTPQKAWKEKSHMAPFNSLKLPYTGSPLHASFSETWFSDAIPSFLPFVCLCHSFPWAFHKPQDRQSEDHLFHWWETHSLSMCPWAGCTEHPPFVITPWQGWQWLWEAIPSWDHGVIATVPSISSWAPSSQNWKEESILLTEYLFGICIFSKEVFFPSDSPWTHENPSVMQQFWNNRTSADKAVLLFSMISESLHYSVSQPVHQSSRCVPMPSRWPSRGHGDTQYLFQGLSGIDFQDHWSGNMFTSNTFLTCLLPIRPLWLCWSSALWFTKVCSHIPKLPGPILHIINT